MNKIIRLTESDLKRIIEMVTAQMNEGIIYEDEYGSVVETDFESTDVLNEAEYKGRKVQLGKIMQGDIKN